MMPIETYKKIETIVLYFVIKKILEISFQNGPEPETTSLRKKQNNSYIGFIFGFKKFHEFCFRQFLENFH